MVRQKIFAMGLLLLLSVIWLLPAVKIVCAQVADEDRWETIEDKELKTAEKEKKAKHYFEQGKKLHEAQKYTEAIEAYQKALVLNPELVQARRALAWAKRDQQRQARSSTESGNTLDALVKEAVDDYKRGRMFERENKLLEAAAAYKDALRIIPGYPEAKDALQRVQSQAQRTLAPLPYSATANSSKAPQAYAPLNMTSSDSTFKTVKTPAAASESRMESAPAKTKLVPVVATYKAPSSKAAASRQPESADDQQNIRGAIQKHYLTGCQALDQGDYTTAIKEFELIIEFDPTHREAQYKLNVAKKHQVAEIKTAQQQADLAQSQGDTVGALSALRDIVNIDPNNQEALAAWEKTKRENKNIVSDIYRQGVTAYAKGDYTKALHAWELVLDIDPENVKAQESIQKVREKMELLK